MHTTIKKDLPNFPDEVIVDWLEPFAISNGWPPADPRWRGILGRSVDEWKNTSWQKVEVDLNTLQYAQETHDAINGLRDAYILHKKNAFSESLGKSGEQRYLQAFSYTIEHGIFPKPVVILQQDCFYHLVDGNHRFLALKYALQLQTELLEISKIERDKFEVELQKKWKISRISPVTARQTIWLAKDPDSLA